MQAVFESFNSESKKAMIEYIAQEYKEEVLQEILKDSCSEIIFRRLLDSLDIDEAHNLLETLKKSYKSLEEYREDIKRQYELLSRIEKRGGAKCKKQ